MFCKLLVTTQIVDKVKELAAEGVQAVLSLHKLNPHNLSDHNWESWDCDC